jgi:carbamoyltransferase
LLIAGLNTSGYVSSAALVQDGQLVYACAEERIDRQKQSKYFPLGALRSGLDFLGARIEDVDCFAIGYNPAISIGSRTRTGFSEWPGYSGARFYSNPNYLLPAIGPADYEETLQIFRRRGGPETRLRYVAHHTAHAANAFLLSEFNRAATFTCDGYGERATTTFGTAGPDGLRTIKEIDFPHSVGSVYAAITQFLGFRPNSDEWKVMGAAAYGDPARYRDAFRLLLSWGSGGGYEVDLSYFNYFDFDVSPMWRPKLETLLGPPRRVENALVQRHYDIAAALQELTENYLMDALRWLREETGLASVCMAGGVLMNCVFNGRAALDSPFEHMFVPYAPDDNGNSVGAALWTAWREGEVSPGSVSVTPFLGRGFSDEAIRDTLDRYKIGYSRPHDIAEAAAAVIVGGHILGWFQGRAEFGDRALGGRSILADPRDAAMKDRINRAVKYREPFRPFAPAILAERQTEYFDIARPLPTPYMEKALPVRPEMRLRIPAVVHQDGTARLQTVEKREAPHLHALLNAFERRSGVPVVLNTSFNLNSEPIVDSPTDAIRTYFSSGLDALAIGPFLLIKGTPE